MWPSILAEAQKTQSETCFVLELPPHSMGPEVATHGDFSNFR
jgi:hypothetical protein